MNINQLFEATATLQKAETETETAPTLDIDKTFGISKTMKEFSSNLIITLGKTIPKIDESYIKESEERDAVKSVIMEGMLKVPENFETLKITVKSKALIIKDLLLEKEKIKMAVVGKTKAVRDFKQSTVDAIDIVFKVNTLRTLVVKNLATTYTNIINAIAENVGADLVKKYSKTFGTNVATRVNEALTIHYLISDLNVPNKESIDRTYYKKHPEGKEKYPDFTIFLRNDENGKTIRNRFSIPDKVDVVFVEGKMGRVVGKQTSPKKLKEILNNDNLWDKFATLPVGGSINLITDEVKKILKALGIDFNHPSLSINLKAKTPKGQIKLFSFMRMPPASEGWDVKRQSKGQIKFWYKGTKLFGIEIGSGGYKNGIMIPAKK